jgi:hypothetical protein
MLVALIALLERAGVKHRAAGLLPNPHLLEQCYASFSIISFSRLQEAQQSAFWNDLARVYTSTVEAGCQLVLTDVGIEKLDTNQLIFMKSVWRCEAFSGIV